MRLMVKSQAPNPNSQCTARIANLQNQRANWDFR